MDCSPPGFTVHGDFPGKNREVGCHALLQGIFWIWGLNPYLLTLLHWQVDSLPLVPPEKPKFLHTSSQSITSTPGNHCFDFFLPQMSSSVCYRNSYKLNHALYILLCKASLTQPFYYWIVFYCMNAPYIVYPFSYQWTSKLFPVWGCFE